MAPVCRFFNTPQGCRNGSSCTFQHISPSSSVPNTPLEPASLAPPNASDIPCRNFLKGYCPIGDKCWFSHQTNDSKECGICFEVPKEYGLLIQCDHAFCLSCINSWRNKNNKDFELQQSEVIKTCPMCRSPSDYIVPASRFVKGEEKQALIESFKDKMKQILCRHIVKSRQLKLPVPMCPFGDQCLYAHLDAHGNRLEVVRQGTPRRRMNNNNIAHSIEMLQRIFNQHLVWDTETRDIHLVIEEPLFNDEEDDFDDDEDEDDYEDDYEDEYLDDYHDYDCFGSDIDADELEFYEYY